MIRRARSSIPRLDCSVISNLKQLEGLTPAWLDLLPRTTSNEPTLSPAWILSWWRTFGGQGGRQLCVGCFHKDGRLVGLAPFLRRRCWYRPGIPFRRLEPLGTGEPEEEAICPEYLNILAERGLEQEVGAALAAALVRGDFGSWDELLLPDMDGDSPLPTVWAEAFREVGLACASRATASASYIPLPASWDDYLQALPSSRRYFVRQSLRRFERWAGQDSRLHVASNTAELREGRRILTALHQGRWGEEAGKFGMPRFAAFHEAVMPLLLESGALELLWLSVRGEPVAANYNIVWNGKVHFYQSGRKVDVPSGVRPGIVLHTHAIRRAIEAGRREYDFLGGGEHYKGQMALADRPLLQLRVARHSLREQARAVAERGIEWARLLRVRLRKRHAGVPNSSAEPREDRHEEEST